MNSTASTKAIQGNISTKISTTLSNRLPKIWCTAKSTLSRNTLVCSKVTKRIFQALIKYCTYKNLIFARKWLKLMNTGELMYKKKFQDSSSLRDWIINLFFLWTPDWSRLFKIFPRLIHRISQSKVSLRAADLALWTMKWITRARGLCLQHFSWGRNYKPRERYLLMLPPWNGTTTSARFTKIRLNMLVQLLIEWELFHCGGNLLFFNTNFVQRFCCFNKSKEIPVFATLGIIKLQIDGVFGRCETWLEILSFVLGQDT